MVIGEIVAYCMLLYTGGMTKLAVIFSLTAGICHDAALQNLLYCSGHASLQLTHQDGASVHCSICCDKLVLSLKYKAPELFERRRLHFNDLHQIKRIAKRCLFVWFNVHQHDNSCLDGSYLADADSRVKRATKCNASSHYSYIST